MTDDKTITIAGESGRISITPYTTTNSPSTARIYSEDLSSTLKTTHPFLDEKLFSPEPTTKRIFETTVTQKPTAAENKATESFLTIAPIEATTRETIPAVSQPRPFGYPRRRGSTTPSTTISEYAYSSRGNEPTSRTKVSTHTRNISRSTTTTTTKSPRTRTRTRTRNHDKSVSTVDDDLLSFKNEALQRDSEYQENQRDSEAVSSSRSTKTNRGSSRFRRPNLTQSQDSISKKSLENEEITRKVETFNLRQRRPVKATTVQTDLENDKVFRISSEQRSRNKNFHRTSRTKLDQQAADSFNSKTKTLRGFYIVKEPKVLSSTVTPATEKRQSISPATTTELRQTAYTATTKINPTTPEIHLKDEETTMPEETTHFLIEITEPTLFDTTTDLIEEETLNSVESSSQTMAPPFSWSSYLSTIDLNDELLTTLFDTSTVSTKRKSSTATLRNNEETSSTVQKIRSRGRSTTTPSSVEQSDKNNYESRRRKIVRRLRPVQDQTSTTLNDYEQNKRTTIPSFSYATSSKIPNSRFYARAKTTSKPDSDTTLENEVSINGESGNKRKHLFQRYRGTVTTPSTRQNDVKNHKFTDEETYGDDSEQSTSKNAHKFNEDTAENESSRSETRKKTRKPSKNSENNNFENFTSKNKVTVRYQPKTTSTTESSAQETLIPTKKFDYFADALKRGTQLQRTTPKFGSEDSFPLSTSKPLVTRLVTSIVESGTTERQKISIKKKYSSLTSTTYIPKSTTSSPYFFFKKRKNNQRDELLNEIPFSYSTEQSVEWSTLPIESEFVDKRFTTETSADSSSTIEIESVFSNLIGHK